jgi:hypothetical protein
MQFTEINANTGTGISGTVTAGDILTIIFISLQTAADNTGLPVTYTDSFPGNVYNLVPGLHNINVPCTVSGRFISYGVYVCPRALGSLTTSAPVPSAFTTPSTLGTDQFCGEFRSTIGIGSFLNNGLAILLSQTTAFSLNAGNTPNGIDELVIGATITTAAGVGPVGPRFTSYLNELNTPSTSTDWGWQDANVLGGTGVVVAGVNPGTPVPPSKVQIAAGTFASGTSFAQAFTSNNAVGNCIVVTVYEYSFSSVLPGISDTNGNTYTLLTSSSSFPGQGVYVFAALNIAAGANTVTVTLATAAPLGMIIHEFAGVGHASASDGAANNDSGGTPTSLTVGPITTTQTPDLLVTFCANNNSSSTIPSPPTGYLGGGTVTGNNMVIASAYLLNASAGSHSATWNLTNSGSSTNVSLVALKGQFTTSPETMGMLFRLAANNFAGGSASSSLAFNIRKAPEPIVPKEGRAIATVQIDATQITHTPLSAQALAYPEITFDNQITPTNGWQSFAIAEFDLEHITNRGQGLSEVRGLIAVSRPMFQIDVVGNATDFPGSAGYNMGHGLALLTNVSTLQCAILGSAAMSWQQSLNSQGAPIETMHLAYPASKGGMKFRLILLCDQYPLQGGGTTGIGKYTLNFTNYELPSTFISIGSWFGNQQ